MKIFKTLIGSIMATALAVAPLSAHDRNLSTLESAADAVEAMGDTSRSRASRRAAGLHDAAGVAVIPNVVKVGLVIDGRFGRGVVLAHQPDGGWSNPVFLTLAGGGVGWQAGVQSTDVILVFKTRESLDRLLRGKDKVTLGGDVGVAAGPLGRQVEADTDARLKAEIYSYSRSRGLFAGVSLEGAGLLVDHEANEAFYGPKYGRPADVIAQSGSEVAEVNRLKEHLMRLTPPPPPPVIIVPEGPAPAPPPPPPLAPPGR